jgi:outer membrane protein assembly factor BamB
VVYVPRFDGALYAVRASDGGVLWQLYLGEERHVGPALPGALGAQTSCEWDVPVGAPLYAPPAIAADGTVIVGSGEGFLYAVGEAR